MESGIQTAQFFESLITSRRYFIGTCRGRLEYTKDNAVGSVELGVAVVRRVDYRNICDILETHRADSFIIDKKCGCYILCTCEFFTYSKKPGIIIFIVDVTQRHREVLSIYKL